MSSSPSTTPSSFSSDARDCEADPRSAHHLLRSSSPSPTTPPSHTNPRFSSSDVLQHRADPGPALLPQSAMKLSAPTPTRTTPPPLPHPGASRPTPNQHHPRKKEPSATSTAVRAFPVQLAYQGQRGDTTHLDPFHVLMPCKSSCAVYCIQWNTSKKAVGIPPRLISFVPALCDWRWLGSCPPYAGF